MQFETCLHSVFKCHIWDLALLPNGLLLSLEPTVGAIKVAWNHLHRNFTHANTSLKMEFWDLQLPTLIEEIWQKTAWPPSQTKCFQSSVFNGPRRAGDAFKEFCIVAFSALSRVKACVKRNHPTDPGHWCYSGPSGPAGLNNVLQVPYTFLQRSAIRSKPVGAKYLGGLLQWTGWCW